MKELISALRKYDNLETVIAIMEAYDNDENEEMTVDEIVDYLNEEADYAS